MRDACADFIRERDSVEEEEDDADTVDDDDEDDDDDDEYHSEKGLVPKEHRLFHNIRDELPTKDQTQRERAARKSKKQLRNLYGDEAGFLNFGQTTDESRYSRRRMRIKVCGR